MLHNERYGGCASKFTRKPGTDSSQAVIDPQNAQQCVTVPREHRSSSTDSKASIISSKQVNVTPLF
jgi:hypothetical protein